MALAGYAEDAFTWEGSTRRVFRRGSGPAVLVIHEVPGITPAVLAFADRDEALARVKERAAAGMCVLGMRFTRDIHVPAERFARLRKELGDAFVGVEIDSSPGNPHGIPRMAHSVLTEHLNDARGHPTQAAQEQVLQLFRTRLVDTS